MLGSLFHYLTTPAPLRFRRSGHLRASVALHSRSRRCRTAWTPHLDATRRAILAGVRDIRNRASVVVLGSGLLDDIPLPELVAQAGRVTLVDAIHPWPARLAARRHANVQLVTADLVDGSLHDLLRALAPDFVVSANVLSQLPILPIERAEARGLDGAGMGRAIIEDHLAALTAYGGPVSLVSDTWQREEGRDGRVWEELDLLYGVSLPPPPLSWEWELAPFGEMGRHRRLIHTVAAYPIWPPAAATASR